MSNNETSGNPYLSIRREEEQSDPVAPIAPPADLKPDEHLPPAAAEPPTRKRRKALWVAVVLLGLVCAGLGAYALFGGKKGVEYKIAEKKRGRGQAWTATGTEDAEPNQITADAIRQAKEALGKSGEAPTPTPQIAGADPAHGSTPAFGQFKIPDPAPDPQTKKEESAGGGGIRTTGGGRELHASAPAAAHSVYVGGEKEPAREIYSNAAAAQAPQSPYPNPSREAAVFNSTPAMAMARAVPVPGFGSMLPVRTLGKIFTLRSSLVRLETTRDVEGDGWRMKRGTVLVARQEGSEYDRAYLTLMGFIDPNTNRLVKLGGELMGGDGAPGLRGKRREVSSRWARVFSRAASSAVQLGSAALSRGSSTVIYPGSIGGGTEFGFSPSTISRREFVEVPASTQAYVMVTELPATARGIDAEPAKPQTADYLADEELAELLSTGRPEEIRAALPRMTPEMRKVAMLALGEK